MFSLLREELLYLMVAQILPNFQDLMQRGELLLVSIFLSSTAIG